MYLMLMETSNIIDFCCVQYFYASFQMQHFSSTNSTTVAQQVFTITLLAAHEAVKLTTIIANSFDTGF